MAFKINDIKAFISAMTLEEKVSLLSGKDFWYSKSIERLGIESWMMTDGPHGMRKQSTAADKVGLNASVPSTCFPSGSALAATWNPELVGKMGEAMGIEARAEKVKILLGPAVNIKRSPLCGRNFEYFSEDPYLSGELAKAHIRGIQSTGVGTSIKHFAVNNQERNRMVVDAVIDERTMHEIYLPAFEAAVRDAQPWTVMCAYNKINGTYCSQNKMLLTDILRTRWGFDGVVMTDWTACDDRVAGVLAGQDLEMPGNGGINDRLVLEAVKNGTLAEKDLDRVVERLLVLHERVMAADDKAPVAFDADAHHRLARAVAQEAIVLLKNNDGLLPLGKEQKVALIGNFAKHPRYQGGGSSHINPTRLDSLNDELKGSFASLSYADGYPRDSDRPDEALIKEACAVARDADTVILCVGLIDTYESEGFDRSHIKLPESHTALIDAIAQVQKRVVVVLSNGSPVEMPWIESVPAVVEGYLAGQAGGGALADILTGKINPSGKLAETFPLRLEDTPAFLNFPGNRHTVEYREGIFVGYRHYDSIKRPVLFPFGHGLSYTTFAYSDLALSSPTFTNDDKLNVSVTVTNTGAVAGKETVQFYVHEKKSEVIRPEQELKAFAKISLAAGESKRITVTLDWRSFAWFETNGSDWRVSEGDFEIRTGSSCSTITQTATVKAAGSVRPIRTWTRLNTLGDVLNDRNMHSVSKPVLECLDRMFGNSTDPGSAEAIMMENMFKEMPLRCLGQFGGPKAAAFLEEVLAVLNGQKNISSLKAPE